VALDQQTLDEIGVFVAEEVARQLAARGPAILAYEGVVATQAIIGTPATRTVTGPNGDPITEAAVWLNAQDVERTAATVVWCTVRRGVTVNPDDRVRESRNSSASSDWFIDARR
jgi:hypothetical protein